MRGELEHGMRTPAGCNTGVPDHRENSNQDERQGMVDIKLKGLSEIGCTCRAIIPRDSVQQA